MIHVAPLSRWAVAWSQERFSEDGPCDVTRPISSRSPQRHLDLAVQRAARARTGIECFAWTLVRVKWNSGVSLTRSEPAEKPCPERIASDRGTESTPGH